jgi:predicted nucleic acid-binding protein
MGLVEGGRRDRERRLFASSTVDAAEFSFIDSLASGFLVPTLDPQGLRDARLLCARHPEQQLGLADASTVVLAARFSPSYLATFDERHFRPNPCIALAETTRKIR